MIKAEPHYEKCLTGLANSILKRFGVPPVGPTLPPADTLLEKHHRNTVVFLLDGMGRSVFFGHIWWIRIIRFSPRRPSRLRHRF